MSRAGVTALRVAITALLAITAAASCSGGRAAAPAPVAYLRVVADPRSATVFENDQFLGSARLLAEQPKPLSPGVKYLTFKAPGYFPIELRLDVPPGLSTIKVTLRPIPL